MISLGESVFEVWINPSDPWAWASLVGDALDLIPGVTGIGETTRVIGKTKDATEAVHIAKATDFTLVAAELVEVLHKRKGPTKSTRKTGIQIHKGYKATDDFAKSGKEYRKIKGIRPDYIDIDNKTIYELKPMNSKGVRDGIRQLRKYNKALGGGYHMRLELY